MNDTVGIVGGTGWLGGALARALLDRQVLSPSRLMVSNRSGENPLSGQCVRVLRDSQALVDACGVIVLAVRPEQFKALSLSAAGKTVISFMAGVTAEAIREQTGCRAVVRAMPNAAVDIGESFTPWYAPAELASEDVSRVETLLSSVGEACRVLSEDQLDYLSALSGTGPAFPALMMTALTAQAIAAGIHPDAARRAARGVMVGASRLLAENDPAELLDRLDAYRGVSSAVIRSMRDDGLEVSVGKALEAGAAVARGGL